MVTRARKTRVVERTDDGSVVTLSELPGGLRVITESVPGARSAAVGVWVGVGSIDETPRLAGASHFLEHLLFKGTRTRTGQQISEAIDSVGGELNAFTSHEYTCYYAHVLADEVEMAVRLVCDVVLEAKIAAADVDIERQVILEEIAMRDDDPEDALNDLFASAVFGGHAVAEAVIGTVETIEEMTRTQINGYYRRRYSPDKMVVSVAGAVDHAKAVAWVQAVFAPHVDKSVAAAPFRPDSGTRALSGRRVAVAERDIEQAHLCLGSLALPRRHPQRYALAVLNSALGGGMSSRLFRAVREDRGLAYTCYSATSSYAGIGSFSVYAACQPENLGEVAGVIGAELSAARTGLTPEELVRAKGQLVGSMVLGLEDNESRMSRIGKNLLVRNEFTSVENEVAAIRAVTAEEVIAVADLVLADSYAAAVVGPYRRERDLPKELRKILG